MPWYEALLRLGLATGFGFIIGLEREHRHRPAGIKTHVLVCMGAALISLIQVSIVEDTIAQIRLDPTLANALKSDYGRMGAQVISGVGFLGAGTILRTKGTIKGLTTATTLWLIACVGLAVGMGYYLISGMTVCLTTLVLVALHLIQSAIQKGRGVKCLEIMMTNKREAMNFINDYCVFRDIVIRNIDWAEVADGKEDASTFTYHYSLLLPRTITLQTVIMELQMDDSIVHVTDNTNDFSA